MHCLCLYLLSSDEFIRIRLNFEFLNSQFWVRISTSNSILSCSKFDQFWLNSTAKFTNSTFIFDLKQTFIEGSCKRPFFSIKNWQFWMKKLTYNARNGCHFSDLKQFFDLLSLKFDPAKDFWFFKFEFDFGGQIWSRIQNSNLNFHVQFRLFSESNSKFVRAYFLYLSLFFLTLSVSLS